MFKSHESHESRWNHAEVFHHFFYLIFIKKQNSSLQCWSPDGSIQTLNNILWAFFNKETILLSPLGSTFKEKRQLFFFLTFVISDSSLLGSVCLSWLLFHLSFCPVLVPAWTLITLMCLTCTELSPPVFKPASLLLFSHTVWVVNGPCCVFFAVSLFLPLPWLMNWFCLMFWGCLPAWTALLVWTSRINT